MSSLIHWQLAAARAEELRQVGIAGGSRELRGRFARRRPARRWNGRARA
ncbi:MAG: hypothetical protein ABR581_00830 [Thermoleophilaceae bacterium]